MSERPKTADDVRRELGWLYTPDEIEVWLTSAQPLLDGRKPCDLIACGKADEVLAVIAAINDGAYL